jgi:predicted permease
VIRERRRIQLVSKGTDTMETFLQDLRLTVRSLLRSPGFTAAALLTLALGIGVNAAVFSIVSGVLLRPLPYAAPDRLLRLSETNPGQGLSHGNVSPPAFEDFRRQARSFTAMGAFFSLPSIITGRGQPVEVETTFVLGDFFGTLGVPALVGRPLSEDDVTQALRNAVISERFWRGFFGSDPRVIGSAVKFIGRSYTVVGVMPEQFRFPTPATDVWSPRTVLTAMEVGSGTRTQRTLEVVARLADGSSAEQARDECKAIASRLAAEYPTSNAGWSAAVVPLRTTIVGNIDRALVVVLAVVGAILLIVCVNLANMLLARGTRRSREIGIRLAIGASRMRIVRLVLTEPLLLALIGGALGLVLSIWVVRIVLALSAGTLPRVEDVRVDGRVLGFGFLLALITGIIFGIAPALRAAHSNFQESLREGRGVVSRGGGLQRVLVVAEFGMAVVLVVSAGLMARSFLELRNADPGFNPKRLLAVTMQVNITDDAKPIRQIVQRREEWIERIGAIPGVVSVGSTTGLPLREQCRDFIEFTRADGSRAADGALLRANYCLASSGYLKAAGIPLLRGAPLPDDYTRGAPIPAVVSETGARRFWPGQDPVGQLVKVISGGKFAWQHVVVGVVGDVKQLGLREDAPPLFYFTQVGFPRPVYTLVIRTAGDPATVIGPIRAVIRELDPNQPIRSIATLDEVMWESIARDRFFTVLFGVFGGLALLLAAVGIYGVVSYSVAERTHEIGLRMALGATTADVLRLVVGGGMRLVLIGIGLGGASALAATRVLQSQLYGVSTRDGIAFTAAIVVLTIVALLACYAPARRATRVTPTVALRYE